MSTPVIPADALATHDAVRVAVLWLSEEIRALKDATPKTADTLQRIAAIEAVLPLIQQRVEALAAMPRTPDTTPAHGILEASWKFFVELGLTVARFLGLDKRPSLALVYVLLGLAVWGIRSAWVDRDLRDLLIRQNRAEATADSTRDVAARASRARIERNTALTRDTVNATAAGVDSLVTGAAPDAP